MTGSHSDWTTEARERPTSYRLIYLESCLLKMLMLLVDKRVREHLDEEGCIPETQNGFRPTKDQHTEQTQPIHPAVHGQTAKEHTMGRNRYVAYMDLKNAFPLVVRRNTMWSKFDKINIAGPLIDREKLIYERMSYSVKLDGRMAPIFVSFLGLLTGDATSPGFWNIFLANYTVRECEDIKLNGKRAGKLEHADNISLESHPQMGYKQVTSQTGRHSEVHRG